MSADEDLYTTLTGFAGLQALIGNGDSPATYRLYPVVAPQNTTMPAVVYQRISSIPYVNLSDSGGTGLQRIVYQIRSWSPSHKTAYDVIEQVRLAMASATLFTSSIPLNNIDFFNSDTKLYSFIYDFAVKYR